MKIKLKLKIRLLNIINNGDVVNLIKIKFIEKDKRFEYDFDSNYEEKYTSKERLNIAVSKFYVSGSIINRVDYFYIPTFDNMGSEVEKKFKNDDDRYDYLKKLYLSLKEWANNWHGFNDDRESCLEMIGDEWIIGNL